MPRCSIFRIEAEEPVDLDLGFFRESVAALTRTTRPRQEEVHLQSKPETHTGSGAAQAVLFIWAGFRAANS